MDQSGIVVSYWRIEQLIGVLVLEDLGKQPLQISN